MMKFNPKQADLAIFALDPWGVRAPPPGYAGDDGKVHISAVVWPMSKCLGGNTLFYHRLLVFIMYVIKDITYY